jgi:hypothetical protein
MTLITGSAPAAGPGAGGGPRQTSLAGLSSFCTNRPRYSTHSEFIKENVPLALGRVGVHAPDVMIAPAERRQLLLDSRRKPITTALLTSRWAKA